MPAAEKEALREHLESGAAVAFPWGAFGSCAAARQIQTATKRGDVLKRVMSDGVLRFDCPKCDQTLEVGLHVTSVLTASTRESPSGVHYGHPVEFTANAPHLHAEFWGHLVRCHQPDPHPYMSQSAAVVACTDNQPQEGRDG